MQSFESAASRILAPLSELLHKPLYLADSQSAEAGHSFAVRVAAPRVSIVSADGRPFAEEERRLIREIFDVVRLAEESEARYQELEQRMLSLQRENLDLVVKNRLLSEVSSRDTLTGLYNRWFVMEKIDSELNRALRHGSPMSLLMLDLDHFKRINDTYSHIAGDRALVEVGSLLRERVGPLGKVARWGGEEFAVLFAGVGLEEARRCCERVRMAVERLDCSAFAPGWKMSISGGVAERTGLAHYERLVGRADTLLYEAKRDGRNCIRG
jgi:diguanylate cyclase (GGDEF)-like protein